MLDDEELSFRADNVDAVANVVWVFDKEEDARAEEFLGGDGEDEGEGEEGCAGCGEGGDEVGILEGNCLLLVKSWVSSENDIPKMKMMMTKRTAIKT